MRRIGIALLLALAAAAALAKAPNPGPAASGADRRPAASIPAVGSQHDNSRCRGEGLDIDGKDLGSGCCRGLTAIGTEQPDGAACRRTAPPSVLLCTRCGDGVCGRGENRCNCPADCGGSSNRK